MDYKIYKIDGVVVRGPDSIEPAYNEISRSYEDIDGIFRDKLIRRKRSTDWVYTTLSAEDYQVMHDVIYDKIINTGSRYFMITTESPGEGMVESLCYLGTPTKFKSVFGTGETGVVYWTVNLSWIEVQGTKLTSGSNLPI